MTLADVRTEHPLAMTTAAIPSGMISAGFIGFRR